MRNLKQMCQKRLKASLVCMGLVLRCVSSGGVVLSKAQQENKQLVQRLALLRADYHQLRKETNELLRFADKEIGELKLTNTGLAKEFDDLQLRVWELEQQVDELLLYISELAKAETTNGVEAPPQQAVENEDDSLADIFLGIVGGHDATRREVIQALVEQHSLQRWVEVPPLFECNIQKRVLREKIGRCDLVVIVTGHMNHSLTKAVYSLKSSGALAGKVVLLNFRGKSGIVREILKHSREGFGDS